MRTVLTAQEITAIITAYIDQSAVVNFMMIEGDASGDVHCVVDTDVPFERPVV